MNSLLYLTSRNNMLFRRDRTLVFLSLLAVVIVILLYAVFLQQTQIETIEQMVGATSAMKSMVNEWMVAGLLSITAVTTTLGAFGIMVRDKESNKTDDFLTAPLSRAIFQLSYVLNAFFIGFVFSLIAFIGCEMFLVLTGSDWLSLGEIFQVLGVILLSVALSSSINLFLVLFIHTQNAFSTLSTIVGTAIGFLCGVYVPIGGVPTVVQHIIMYFPVSHTTLLFRQIFMTDSMNEVFEGAKPEQLLEYKTHYGIVYEMNQAIVSNAMSIGLILITMLLFIIITIILFKRRNQ